LIKRVRTTKIPRIIIAGTNSGCGKTTITTGIMAALVKRGVKVQPFKVGPDYIDPMFHTFITGRDSRNLDSWMLSEDTVAYLFARNCANANIAVIEGVMGLYDGYGGRSETGSTAHISRVISSPVALVVNGESISLSVAALIQGFRDFDRDVKLKAVILNNISGEGHYQLLKDIIEENTGIKVAGYLRKEDEYSLGSRHLGLVPSDEVENLREKIDLLSAQVERTIDLELLLKIAGEVEEFLPPTQLPEGVERQSLPPVHLTKGEETLSKVRIAVARDKAFNFYYRDNLDLLEMLGAELVFFSPLNDSRLPPDISGLYIGGGYPEVFAGELQNNVFMREDIRKCILSGLPAYAECGGLMYMSEYIKDKEGRSFDMLGLLSGGSEMTSSLQRFGYVEVEVTKENVLSKEGCKIRAHEFHYSVTNVAPGVPACYRVVKKRKNGEISWTCGFKVHNLLAGYPHLHFWSNPDFARTFVDNCGKKLYSCPLPVRKARCIMIQGTASSVGKSLITAGLCRLFKQDGYRVAPFKSQNMALNSFITGEGKEMGRAQVVQAEAAGIEPSVEMNPILLKPTTDKKAQVIINGEVYKNMSAVEYHEFKPELAEMVRDTYNRLAEKNDIVVIEGAGSPAEINLRDKDIVNMGMAEIADAPVILVGDIDKGGVFASLAGTMLLLTEEEKVRVKGVIINKFRGDVEILKPGIKMLEDIIKVPVLGVLPYEKLNIEDEDSLAERFAGSRERIEGDIDIAVIKLPHISNFTDFNFLENLQGVRLRYVERVSDMGNPDMIILPGSKNTIEDLLFVRKTGIEDEIKKLHEEGAVVFGICGGYQMLGVKISDPHMTESNILEIDGMGLLNIETVFQQKKITTQVEAVVSDEAGIISGLKGVKVLGYEIHMGTTDYMEGCVPYLIINSVLGKEADRIDGVRNEDGSVFGTYIHGIFDSTDFTTGLINNLRVRKGLEKIPVGSIGFKEYKEAQYDRLAEMLRNNLDVDAIYKIINGI